MGSLARRLFRRSLTSLQQDGARETIALFEKNVAECARQYVNKRFDQKHNIDTAGIVQLADLTCDSTNKEHGVWYEPTPIRTLKQIFAALPSDLSTFTFVDFGSGKGRTILYASNYGFRKIIGVEFARELHSIAQLNIRTYRSSKQKCHAIESVCIDAADFSIPTGDTVLYFFHPFKNEVMARVLSNIESRLRTSSSRVILLYYHPQLNSMVHQLPFLSKRSSTPMPWDLSAVRSPYRRRLEVYDSNPDAN